MTYSLKLVHRAVLWLSDPKTQSFCSMISRFSDNRTLAFSHKGSMLKIQCQIFFTKPVTKVYEDCQWKRIQNALPMKANSCKSRIFKILKSRICRYIENDISIALDKLQSKRYPHISCIYSSTVTKVHILPRFALQSDAF